MKKLAKVITLCTFAGLFFVMFNACDKDDDTVKMGCTDPTADNFDPAAEVDDGSCIYQMVAYNAADGFDGGLFYDKFYSSDTKWEGPSDPTVMLEDIRDYGDFYRCKQCHGWDLLGRAGAYIGRAPKTTRPNVANGIKSFVQDAEIGELFDAIKNDGGRLVDPGLTSDGTNGDGDAHPDYSKIFTDDEIWDIVKFLKEEAIDIDELYDFETEGTYPTGSITYSNIGKGGDAESGMIFFTAADCSSASCHGPDGTARLIEDELTVGRFLREKPYEVHHKVKFGQPGSDPPMEAKLVTLQELKDLYKALTDTVMFPD